MLFTLLNRGGISSMWSLVGVTLFGFTVAGMLDHMDVLKCIADSTVKHIHGTAGVTFLTILFGFVGNAVAMSQNFAIVMSGTLMAPLYKRYNMLPKIVPVIWKQGEHTEHYSSHGTQMHYSAPAHWVYLYCRLFHIFRCFTLRRL